MKFIQYCSTQHLTTGFESHHILPKAKTLFPDYASLKVYAWNEIKLTPQQHFIAHWLLWKAMGNFMAYAFSAMRRKSKYQTNRYFKITGKVYANLREDVRTAQSTRIISDETRIKMSQGQKNKLKIMCPHCNKIGSESNMKRWHFNNCKILTGLSKHTVKQDHTIVTCPHCLKTGKLQGMHSMHFDNCNIVKPKLSKDKITCPHCLKEITNTKNFTKLHFDNCPTFTGIARIQSLAHKAANIKRSIALFGKPKPRIR